MVIINDLLYSGTVPLDIKAFKTLAKILMIDDLLKINECFIIYDNAHNCEIIFSRLNLIEVNIKYTNRWGEVKEDIYDFTSNESVYKIGKLNDSYIMVK